MAALDSVRTRPAVAAVVFGVLLVVIAMVVPVSYQRVVGQDVALTFAGKGIGREQIGAIARELKGVLGSDGVVVDASAVDQGTQFVLRATSPQRSGAGVQRVAGEFARGLAAKGYSASFQVTPHRERVRYPAAAYAWDQIIRISVDGKSAAQLQSEIQSRLSDAGVPDAQVSVTDRPEGGREIKLKVERQAVGDASTATPEPLPQVVLTKDGAPLAGGEGFAVKIQKKKINDAVTLTVEVTSNDKSAKAEVPNSQSMSDADLANAITTQLTQAGVEARVTVVAGKVSVEPVK
ncbi:MAG TPA: hypothetical protein VK527_00310 [Candidatus Limnocylindrales bacterium]|nr:hypothetical protein [Candidatus Limnocylindrales bacterium]